MSNEKIKVDLGIKINLGNYQTLDIAVGIEGNPKEGENIREATDRIYNFVDTYLEEKIETTVKDVQKTLG